MRSVTAMCSQRPAGRRRRPAIAPASARAPDLARTGRARAPGPGRRRARDQAAALRRAASPRRPARDLAAIAWASRSSGAAAPASPRAAPPRARARRSRSARSGQSSTSPRAPARLALVAPAPGRIEHAGARRPANTASTSSSTARSSGTRCPAARRPAGRGSRAHPSAAAPRRWSRTCQRRSGSAPWKLKIDCFSSPTTKMVRVPWRRRGARPLAGEELLGQRLDDRPLLGVGVLRLVDQDVVDAAVELVEHPGRDARPRSRSRAFRIRSS